MSRWFVSRQGKLKGPFTLSQLQDMVKAGDLKSGDLVCPEGKAPTVASRVPGLFDQAPASPKPVTAKTAPAAPVKAELVRTPAVVPAEPRSEPSAPQAPTRSAPLAVQPNTTAATEIDDEVFGMSRLVYWGAMLGGWSALAGWGVAELCIGRRVSDHVAYAILMVVVVATLLGAGLSQASGLTAFQGKKQLAFLGPGLLGGLIGGVVGGLFGNLLFYLIGDRFVVLAFLGRVLGWTLLGVAIGISDGVLTRDWRKIRNGLIGGSVGGFVGGLIFNPVTSLIGSPVSSRAFAFVAVGLCIGLFISLVEVLLKEAWLTVEAGFRPGRQLILKEQSTTMGTSEKASLIFIAYGAKGVEPIHLNIRREDDGSFLLEDCHSRSGTLLNGAPVTKLTSLKDGDLIQLGVNKVRFGMQVKRHVAQV